MTNEIKFKTNKECFKCFPKELTSTDIDNINSREN